MDINPKVHDGVELFRRRGFKRQSGMLGRVISFSTLNISLAAALAFLTAMPLFEQQARAQGITTGSIQAPWPTPRVP